MATVNSPEYSQWIELLQRGIVNILQATRGFPTPENSFIDDENPAQIYISPEATLIWAQAFTPPNVEIDEKKNYEKLELLGDAILRTEFMTYIMDKYPMVKTGGISELQNYYMSKPYQIVLANKMNLGPLIRRKGNDEKLEAQLQKVIGDVFESFFGALYTIVAKISPSKSSLATKSVIYALFYDVEINLEVQEGPAITQVNQIFERLYPRPGPLVVTTNQEGGSYTTKIRFADEHLQYFQNFGLDIKGHTISSANGNTKRTSKNNAYEQALKKLTSIGITAAWADEVRANHDFRHPRIAKYLSKIVETCRANGYLKIYFDEPKKLVTSDAKVLTLNAIPENNKDEHIILYSTTVPLKNTDPNKNLELEARVDLVEKLIA